MNILVCPVCGNIVSDPCVGISEHGSICFSCESGTLVEIPISEEEYLANVGNFPSKAEREQDETAFNIYESKRRPFDRKIFEEYIIPMGKINPNLDDYKENITYIYQGSDALNALYESKHPHSYNNSCAPKCPTCGSTNVRKLDIIDRGLSVITLGLFSKKINKSFECKNCKYTW